MNYKVVNKFLSGLHFGDVISDADPVFHQDIIDLGWVVPTDETVVDETPVDTVETLVE